jgi:hypothetical protein
MSTRLKLALALALGALTLLPAGAAQAATLTPSTLSFSSSFNVESAPQTVTYSVSALDPPGAHQPFIFINDGGSSAYWFHITPGDNCESLPTSGSASCAVSLAFTPQGYGSTTHSNLYFTSPDDTSTVYTKASLTGVAAPASNAGGNGGKGKKCHKKGKKASAAKKCKKKKH